MSFQLLVIVKWFSINNYTCIIYYVVDCADDPIQTKNLHGMGRACMCVCVSCALLLRFQEEERRKREELENQQREEERLRRRERLEKETSLRDRLTRSLQELEQRRQEVHRELLLRSQPGGTLRSAVVIPQEDS